MTSTAATVNWTADGSDMVNIDGICLHTLVRGGPGEPAQTRGEPDTIPALVGQQPRLWEKNLRVIEFRGFVRGSGSDEAAQRADYWDNRAALESTLDPTAVITLAITVGGNDFTIDARPTSVAYNERLPSIAEVSVEFESYDPDWAAA